MNMKKILTITILMIFVVGMCISAADAAHTIKYGKYKVKISNKEYKKLNQYETKYKTVTKTRTVEKTKTKEVEVTKKEYYNETHTELYREYYDKKNETSQTGYLHWNDRPASKYYYFFNKTVNYNYDLKNSTYHIYKEEYGKYNTTELRTWTEWEPRKYKVNVTEKYTVKKPYTVRVNAKVQKTVGYKKVKEYCRVGYKYKTAYIKNVKTQTWRDYYDKNGRYIGCRKFIHHQGYWKNNNACWIGSKYKTVNHYNNDGSYYEDLITYETWRIPHKVKVPVFKYVKVKKPIVMNVYTTDFAGNLLKGKRVYVEIYCNGKWLGEGYSIIK